MIQSTKPLAVQTLHEYTCGSQYTPSLKVRVTGQMQFEKVLQEIWFRTEETLKLKKDALGRKHGLRLKRRTSIVSMQSR